MWFGWRTGTRMSVVLHGKHWNTPHAHRLSLEMNQMMVNASSSLVLEMIEAYSATMSLKDNLHPAYAFSVKIVDLILHQVNQYFVDMLDC
jgi:hypothetical protein